MVAHDRWLLSQTGCEIWALDEQGIHHFPTFQAYDDDRHAKAAAAVSETKKEQPAISPAEGDAQRRSMSREELKRLKREQLQQLLENAWRASAEALLAACGKPDPADIPGAEELRRGLTVRQLQGMTDLMKQYCLECRYNVGVGHVLGALCAGWEKLL